MNRRSPLLETSATDGGPRREPELRLDAYLPYRLSTAASAVTSLIARAYQDRFNLTIPQWRLMSVLAEDGPSTEAELVARTVMDKGIVAEAANGLERRDLVSRGPNGDAVALTPSGTGLYGEIAPLALAYEAALIAGLAPDEVKLLKRLLARLQSAAGQLAGDTDQPRG